MRIALRVRPSCRCHDAEMYPNNNSTGWRCAVKALARARNRYDSNPILRIEKNLHDHARRRGQTLQRRKEAL